MRRGSSGYGTCSFGNNLACRSVYFYAHLVCQVVTIDHVQRRGLWLRRGVGNEFTQSHGQRGWIITVTLWLWSKMFKSRPQRAWRNHIYKTTFIVDTAKYYSLRNSRMYVNYLTWPIHSAQDAPRPSAEIVSFSLIPGNRKRGNAGKWSRSADRRGTFHCEDARLPLTQGTYARLLLDEMQFFLLDQTAMKCVWPVRKRLGKVNLLYIYECA